MYQNEVNYINYTKNEIEKYYAYYINNLIESPFKFIWLHPSKIKMRNNIDRNWSIVRTKDPYINQYLKNKKHLGLDILKNGTYWPLSIYKENESYYISEGIHRLESINLLIKENLWGRRELFCMLIPKELDFSQILKARNWKREYLSVFVPVYNTDNKDFINTIYSYLMYDKDNKQKIENAKEGDIVKLETDNLKHYFLAFKLMPRFLRHVFHYYKSNNTDIIKPCELVNDEKKSFLGRPIWNEN